MKNYRTAGSDEGLRLPHSGFIIGRVADALRLKAALRDALGASGYKTAQRYFDGERIEPETVDRVLDVLVSTAVPASINLPPESGTTEALKSFVAGGMKFHARTWDQIAARTNSLCFPVYEQKDLPIPALRLLMLDVGLRWGAWLNLQALGNREVPTAAWWLEETAIGQLIDAWRTHEPGSPLETLAATVGVSAQSLSAWRSGAALPTADNVEALAAALSDGPEQRQHREFVLRLVVGLRSLHRELVQVCGGERMDDMTRAMAKTSEIVHRSFKVARSVPGMNDKAIAPRLWNVVFFGGRCPVGADLCGMLAAQARCVPEVAADFTALTGDLAERMHHWMMLLGRVPDEIDHLRVRFAGTEAPPTERVEPLVRAALDHALRMADFDRAPPAHSYRVSGPPEFKALNRAAQAEQALSIEDFESALEHLRIAVHHEPRNPVYHFKLGAVLGIQGLRSAKLPMMEEGVLECRLAYQLDPDLGNARNEVGIILSNMRCHEDAEAAFAEAEPFFGAHAHHWLARAGNYVALHRIHDARDAYRKAIELSKDGAHVEAMARLAAVLMRLGRQGEARRLGRKVHHLVGVDPCDQVDAVLDIWKGNPFVRCTEAK